MGAEAESHRKGAGVVRAMEKSDLDIISSPETEKALLGCLMNEPEMIDQVVPILEVEDFYVTKNREIYQAILNLRGNSELTYHSVAHELGARLQAVGGIYELGGYLEYAAFRLEAVGYAKIIADKARAKRIIDAPRIAARELRAGASLEEVEHLLQDLSVSRNHNQSATLEHSVKEAMTAFEDSVKNKGRSRGLSTGFWDLDKMTGGFERGELTVLAGRPSQGKTALAIGLAHKVLKKGNSVFFASIEMTTRSLIQRMAYGLARVDGQKYNYGDFNPGDIARLRDECDKIRSLPLEIDDKGGQSVGEILAKARILKPAMLIIDYLQLLAAPKRGMKLYEKVTENSLACKTMAKNLGIPVLLLSQLSRAPEIRGNKRPVMSDLRESGAIEQDADHIWMLYRAETYGIPNMENMAELIIAKNRNGPTGEINLTFLKKFISFEAYFKETI